MPDDPLHWHAADAPALAAGDAVAVRRWAEAALLDEARAGRLRALLHGLEPGVALVRSSDPQVVDALVAAVVSGRLRIDAVRTRRPLLVLAPPPAAPAAAPPPPAASSRAAPAAAPSAPESTFDDSVDVAAMVAVLQQAAREGTPLCEECARREAAAAAT